MNLHIFKSFFESGGRKSVPMDWLCELILITAEHPFASGFVITVLTSWIMMFIFLKSSKEDD